MRLPSPQVVAALVLALLVLIVGGARAATTTSSHARTAPPPGSSCGQTIDVAPRRSLGPGPPPLAIGDSVLYDAAQPLAYYGFHVNAMICRTMEQGIAWLQAHDRDLPVLIVVALGTNGGVTGLQIKQLLTILGPERLLVMVTPHNGNDAYTPRLIRAAAQQHPGRVDVLDWEQLSAGHPEWFAPDGIHLGSSAGINAYAQLVASALLGTPTPRTPTAAPPSTRRRSPSPASRSRTRPSPSPKKQMSRAVNVLGSLLAAVEELGSFFGGW
jgi:hypothetical protein